MWLFLILDLNLILHKIKIFIQPISSYNTKIQNRRIFSFMIGNNLLDIYAVSISLSWISWALLLQAINFIFCVW